MIGLMVREERPMQFFGVGAVLAVLAAVALATPVVLAYLHTGLVPRLPTLVVAVGLIVVALLSFFTGLILDAVSHLRLEQRRLAYLALAGPEALTGDAPLRAAAR
jgi:hypothetical protein